MAVALFSPSPNGTAQIRSGRRRGNENINDFTIGLVRQECQHCGGFYHFNSIQFGYYANCVPRETMAPVPTAAAATDCHCSIAFSLFRLAAACEWPSQCKQMEEMDTKDAVQSVR